MPSGNPTEVCLEHSKINELQEKDLKIDFIYMIEILKEEINKSP